MLGIVGTVLLGLVVLYLVFLAVIFGLAGFSAM